MTATPLPTVLCIDATDPNGDTGVNACIRTGTRMGGAVVSVVTAVGVRTREQMLGLFPVPATVISDQLRAVLSSHRPDSILIGLMPTREVVDAVADVLDKMSPRPMVVVDPIMFSRDGKRLIEKDAQDALKRRILPFTDLLLPNVMEAENLTGEAVRDESVLEHAGEMLLTLGPRNIFLKGKILDTEQIHEIYIDDRRTQVFTGDRIEGKSTYGTGAMLASAVAMLIAQGNTPRASVTAARPMIAEFILANPDIPAQA